MTMKEDYRQICRDHNLPLFFQDFYLDAVCMFGSWDAVVLREGEDVVAVMPYHLKSRNGIKYITMPILTKYMGPYYLTAPKSLSQDHQWQEALIDMLPNVDIFKQSFHPSMTNYLPFHWKKYKSTTRYSYYLDLTDMERVRSEINRNMRRNIEKAEGNFRFVIRNDIKTIYEMMVKTYARQNLSPPYTLTQLNTYDNELGKRGARVCAFAEDDSGLVYSAQCLVYDNETGYLQLSGDDPGMRDSGSGIWLTWKMITYASETLGLKTFDFLGSMVENIEAIRRQFGATQMPYFHLTKYRMPIFKTLDRIKNRMM